VKLVKFDDKQKVALIKEVKNLLEGMNLVQVSTSMLILIQGRVARINGEQFCVPEIVLLVESATSFEKC
jgi:hypothetical protein